MMSAQAIRKMSMEAASKAAKENRVPMRLEEEDVELLLNGDVYKVIGQIPFLGNYLPEGWERVDLRELKMTRGVYMGDNEGYGALFVDSTGMGQSWEPALTVEDFGRTIIEHSEYGYAIVEQGPFQVKIGLFRKEDELL